MKRSKFIELLMSHNPDEDIEIVFLADGSGELEFDEFGYHEIYLEDIECIDDRGRVVAISLNTH